MLGRDSRSSMTAASAQPFLKSSRTRRLWSVLWIGFAFLAILLACILLYNNYCFRSQSRSQFNAQLDGALERTTVWIVAHPELSLKNPSIMYMISDMAKMSWRPAPATVAVRIRPEASASLRRTRFVLAPHHGPPFPAAADLRT
jgi:hypothetical protein